MPPARDRFGLYDDVSPRLFAQERVMMAPSKEFDARFAELFGISLAYVVPYDPFTEKFKRSLLLPREYDVN